MAKSASAAEAVSAREVAAHLRATISKLKRRLREQTDPGELTSPQLAVLSRLDRDGPATISMLARAEGMRSQSMGATVAALQNAGLVRGTPDPHDGRQTLMSLSPACRRWIDTGRAAQQDWLLRAIRETYDPDELPKLARATELLGRLVEA